MLASIWCPDCGHRVCEPEELESYEGTECPRPRCGAELEQEDEEED